MVKTLKNERYMELKDGGAVLHLNQEIFYTKEDFDILMKDNQGSLDKQNENIDKAELIVATLKNPKKLEEAKKIKDVMSIVDYLDDKHCLALKKDITAMKGQRTEIEARIKEIKDALERMPKEEPKKEEIKPAC